jgi:drug/metabolite transporter (DMT)-like permease
MGLGVLLALCSACVWGSGDFCGGRATTRMDPIQVLALSALSGIVMLAGLALLAREQLRVDASLGWAAVAGVCTAVGVAALYRGLSIGSAASVAPVAAVTAALLPVVYGVISAGLPRPTQIAGFATALVGIFLVARAAPASAGSRAGMRLGFLAGLGFGSFLVLIAKSGSHAVYLPLAVARIVMFATALVLMMARGTRIPSITSSPVALLAGVFDAGGTALYLLAQMYVRLDIAAVLSSMYPAATVVLSRLVLAETVTPTQWVGALVCVGAVALIAV